MSHKSFISLFIAFLFLQIGNSQVVSLGCQTQDDAVVGLDRKDWMNNGSSSDHSEGYMLNFTLPDEVCKKITEVEITLTVNSVTVTNPGNGCVIGSYWTNIYEGCSSTAPASCPTSEIINDFPSNPLTSQTLTYFCPPHEFGMGETLGVDLVPAMGIGSCPTSQSMISSGEIIIDYEVCVEVTMVDEQIDTPIDLGLDFDICENGSTIIDAGSSYDSYEWDPNGEISQTITVGDGTYTVTVSDSNGCTDTDDIVVTEVSPSVTITSSEPDNTVCPGSTVDLTANTSVSNISWSTSETSNTITVGSGFYTVEVTDTDGCTGTDEITINEYPAPPLTITPSSATVCDNASASVQATTGYAMYNWSNSLTTAQVDLLPGNYTLTITDSNGCTNSASVEITNIDSPYAGVSDATTVCNDGQTYDLDFLLGAPQTGGIWTDDDASGVDVNIDPFATDFSGISGGVYNFTYSVTATAPCLDQSATLTVTVEEAPDSGDDNNDIVCNDGSTVDFDILLGSYDFGGTWIDIDGSGVDLSDIFNVSFNGVAAGTYEFSYNVAAVPPCVDVQSIIEITVLDGVDAGDDNMISVCEGAVVDLITSLSFGVDDSGTWNDDDASGALSGSMFNTMGLQGQTFQFTYTLGSGGSCGMDDAVITVSVETSLSAGIDNLNIEECLGDTIDLFDYLPGADLGGIFIDVDGSGGLENNLLITSVISAGTYFYTYEIGDDVTCPEETSVLEFVFSDNPSFNLLGGTSFCGEGCSTMSLNFAGEAPYIYTYEVYNGAGGITELILDNTNEISFEIEVCNDGGTGNLSNDTIHIGDSFMEWYIVPSAIGDANCNVDLAGIQDTIFFQIADSYNSVINPTLCSSDSVVVNGTTYNISNPTGTEVVINPGDCDSTYMIALDFLPPAENIIDNQLCTGDSIIVNGEVYNEANPTGIEIIIGGSQSSCDSTITIDLNFVQSIENFFNESLCIGDSIFLEGQWQFTSGDYTDSFVSASGCDSLIVTTVIFNSCSVPIDIIVTNNDCMGDEEGVISVSVDNGNPPYTVDWSGNGDSGSFEITQNATPVLLSNLASTTYSLTITDALGEILSILPITINNNSSPFEGEITITTPISCHDEMDGSLTADITGGGGDYSYQWNPDYGNVSNITNLGEGVYSLTVTDQFDCEYILDEELENPDELFADYSTQNITCNSDGGLTIIDWGGGTPNYTIYLDGDIVVNPTDMPPFTSASLAAGTHEFILIDNNGCELIQEIEIINEGGISFDLTSTDSNCSNAQNGTIQVSNITGGNMPYIVTIDGMIVADPYLIENLGAGSYEIVVTDADDCSNSQFATIDEGNISFELSAMNSSCSAAIDGSISVTNIEGGTAPYVITLDGDLIQDPILVEGLSSGTYEIVVTDNENCSSNQMITINSDNDPTLLDYISNYTISDGDVIILEGDLLGNVVTLIWDNDASLSCLDCQNPEASPSITQTYVLTAIDVNGCEQSIQIEVIVIPVVEEEDELYVANIFSPDDNGFNDTFDFLTGADSSITEVECWVYDRWGELVFQAVIAPGAGNGWDGKINSEDVIPGVYVYVINYSTNLQESISKQGNVTIIQ